MVLVAVVIQSQGSSAEAQQGQLPAPVPLPDIPLSAKECGAPWAHCGLSIPKDVECPQVDSVINKAAGSVVDIHLACEAVQHLSQCGIA